MVSISFSLHGQRPSFLCVSFRAHFFYEVQWPSLRHIISCHWSDWTIYNGLCSTLCFATLHFYWEILWEGIFPLSGLVIKGGSSFLEWHGFNLSCLKHVFYTKQHTRMQGSAPDPHLHHYVAGAKILTFLFLWAFPMLQVSVYSPMKCRDETL